MSAVAWLVFLTLLGINSAYLVRMLQFRDAWRRLGSSTGNARVGEEQKSEEQAIGVEEHPHANLSASQILLTSQAPPSHFKTAVSPAFSILVAARNEAGNLPNLFQDLANQEQVPGGFELLIVDDHSTDATAAVVRAAVSTLPFPVQLVQLATQAGAPTGKKAAVQTAVALAQAPWVLLTDADCRVPRGWVRAYAQLIANDAAARFVSGPVLLTGRGWLATLQGLELAGLVGVGAASIGRQAPTMCNGANLAYRRADFFAVDGFRGNEAVPSGDDEFLLHKLHAAFPGSVRFLQEPNAIVRTEAQPTVRQLLRQRVRWASKWRHYQAAAPRRLAVLVLLSNLTFPAGLVLWLAGVVPGALVLSALGLKLLADVLFLRPVLQFLSRSAWLWWVPVLQIAYGPYALATGLLGLRGSYEWKGRKSNAL